jgi:hypothetical protein
VSGLHVSVVQALPS